MLLVEEFKALREKIRRSRIVLAVMDEEIERREDEGIDVRPGLGNPDASWVPMYEGSKVAPAAYTGAGTGCWCQNAYDTGFTGNARIDKKLKAHYDHWLEPDAIRRDYDHYAKHIPYVESTARRPYCFRSKTKGACRDENGRVVWHEECEHARHRAPDTVKRMRWFIEQNCPASAHYVELAERIDRSGDTRPEMDNTAERMARWEDVEFERHKRNPQTDGRAYDPESCPRSRTRPVRLEVISREKFLEDYADGLCTPIEFQIVCDFLAAFGQPESPDPGEYEVSFDPARLAELAAEAANDALFREAVEAEELTSWWARANRVPRAVGHLEIEG